MCLLLFFKRAVGMLIVELFHGMVVGASHGLVLAILTLHELVIMAGSATLGSDLKKEP